MSLKIIKDAIEKQKPVSFVYNKTGNTPGERIGNPHAVWVKRKKDGMESTKVHIVQTEGVSDSGKAFPSFRMFDLEILSEVNLLEDNNKFDISEQYNPEWDEYTFVITKI